MVFLLSSRTMKLLCAAVLLTAVFWKYGCCQRSYMDIPEAERNKIENTSQLLNGTTRLLLFLGVNGAMRNDKRICWTSVKSDNTTPTFHHYIYFFETKNKESAKIGLGIQRNSR
uniref:Lipocalin n=1 Tax=Rhipicephalus appendiculatus TaxID=34631 RepID=A0A131YGV7_RHIAP